MIEADIAFVRVIATIAIIETGLGFIGRAFRLELETRRQHLFHQQAGSNRLQGVVHRLGDGLFGSVGFGDQVGKASASLAGGVAGGAERRGGADGGDSGVVE